MADDYVLIGKGSCQLKNDIVYTLLYSRNDGREWTLVAATKTPSPLVDHPVGVVYEIEKKRYTLEKATTLYFKVVASFDNGDLSGLRKLCPHAGRNDDYLAWALGWITEERALYTKKHNEQHMALHRSFQAGDLSEEEYLRLRDELSNSFSPE